MCENSLFLRIPVSYRGNCDFHTLCRILWKAKLFTKSKPFALRSRAKKGMPFGHRNQRFGHFCGISRASLARFCRDPSRELRRSSAMEIPHKSSRKWAKFEAKSASFWANLATASISSRFKINLLHAREARMKNAREASPRSRVRQRRKPKKLRFGLLKEAQWRSHWASEISNRRRFEIATELQYSDELHSSLWVGCFATHPHSQIAGSDLLKSSKLRLERSKVASQLC